jgi:hypothetical protein
MPSRPVRSSASSCCGRKALAFGGALYLDETAVLEGDDVHVDAGANVLAVIQVQ